ncbi:hypothetical protein IDJ77_05900 [Mucilaginibacter sp. ZT4R22]|uniref:Lipoprotein n=1 Tax=Mucilaginibacter pankratovii TaxID=2772110 RepID=A0ABR7WLY8_9SPHI|nr:hypothetical protein [Mucilaginibacter pankratovii]MBD1363340.1 hypothetical protein [Mucilaginibacter pankratovii]
MKRFLPILLLIVLAVTACKKENSIKETTGPDPIPPKLISSDTLTTGGQWGIAMGQTSAEIYAKVQAMRSERGITHMGIVNNVYTNLESLENKIPLYSSVYLDETKGTSTGIQLNFADDKVNTIFTNDGVQLNSWPAGNDASAKVSVGNPVDAVYQKLVNIKNQGTYAHKFERMSIFFKDVAKAYDPQMSASPQWYFGTIPSNKRYNFVQYIFTAGKLSAIYSTVYEIR